MVFIYLSIHKLNFENSDGNDEFELYYKDIGLNGYRSFLIQQYIIYWKNLKVWLHILKNYVHALKTSGNQKI